MAPALPGLEQRKYQISEIRDASDFIYNSDLTYHGGQLVQPHQRQGDHVVHVAPGRPGAAKWSQSPRRGLKPFLGRIGEMGSQTAGWASWIFIVADFEIFNICDLSFHSTHLLPYDLQFLHRKFLSFIWWIFSCCRECGVSLGPDTTGTAPAWGGQHLQSCHTRVGQSQRETQYYL